jgi:hypothetical protein
MTEIKQCWAFHRDGTRCDMPAGHNGDHMVERTWTDADCAIPGEAKPTVAYPATPQNPVPLVEAPAKCVACGHQHKGGACKCGCHEFIG